MGISCSMLVKEGSNIQTANLYSYLEKICTNYNLLLAINITEEDENKRTKVIRTNISDIAFDKDTSRQLCLDIFDEPYRFKYQSFDWAEEYAVFFELVTIDYFDNNEDLLFTIVHSLLREYPEAKLWIEENWFYTLDDLDKINNEVFNSDWCYKNPTNS